MRCTDQKLSFDSDPLANSSRSRIFQVIVCLQDCYWASTLVYFTYRFNLIRTRKPGFRMGSLSACCSISTDQSVRDTTSALQLSESTDVSSGLVHSKVGPIMDGKPKSCFESASVITFALFARYNCLPSRSPMRDGAYCYLRPIRLKCRFSRVSSGHRNDYTLLGSISTRISQLFHQHEVSSQHEMLR